MPTRYNIYLLYFQIKYIVPLPVDSKANVQVHTNTYVFVLIECYQGHQMRQYMPSRLIDDSVTLFLMTTNYYCCIKMFFQLSPEVYVGTMHVMWGETYYSSSTIMYSNQIIQEALQFMTQVPILKYDRPYVNFLLRNYGFVLPSKRCSSNKYREKFDLCIALYTQVCPKTLTTIKSPLVVRMGPLRICNLENRMIKSVLRYLVQILYNVHRYLLDYGNRKNFESTMEKS